MRGLSYYIHVQLNMSILKPYIYFIANSWSYPNHIDILVSYMNHSTHCDCTCVNEETKFHLIIIARVKNTCQTYSTPQFTCIITTARSTVVHHYDVCYCVSNCLPLARWIEQISGAIVVHCSMWHSSMQPPQWLAIMVITWQQLNMTQKESCTFYLAFKWLTFLFKKNFYLYSWSSRQVAAPAVQLWPMSRTFN